MTNLKFIAETFQKAGKFEEYQKISDLMQENEELKKENKKLFEKLKIKESLIFENNAYWTKEDGKKDGPYCSCCWDDNKKTIRMQPCGNPAYFDCPKCENKNVKIYFDEINCSQEAEDFDQFEVF